MKVVTKIFGIMIIVILGIDIISFQPDKKNVNVKAPLYNNYNDVVKIDEIKKDSEIKENNQKDVVKTPSLAKPNTPADSIKPVTPETVKPVIPTPPVDNQKPVVGDKVLETIVGKMSGYGPDCYGCTSNKTASGYDIENTFYYNDLTYGQVRIVSADSKYPFGTIVKISNFSDFKPIYAIVLDRGGSIGIGKKIQFDLLFLKEELARPHGIQSNVTFEILRLSY